MKMNINEISDREITLNAISLLGLKSKSPITPGTKSMFFHCPFHKDKTPSLSINLDRKIYHCFSCGRKGTIEALFRELTGQSLYKTLGIDTTRNNLSVYAYSMNAKLYNYDYTEDLSLKPVTVNYDPNLIIDINDSPEAQSYLTNRGIPLNIAHSMHMSYTNEMRINLTRFARRLLIPVYEGGKLISIEGRKVIPEDDGPKVLYPKNASVNTLYDFDNLDHDQTLYAVEGLMDLAVLRTCETFKNSTSIFGACLTKRQQALLHDFKKVVYIYDLDDAGNKTLEALKAINDGNIFSLKLPSEINGVKIKDVGDLPKAHVLPQDLVDKRWLNHILPL